ncbi:MAG: hypothetical protein NTY47_03695, partial [Candidatus Omnitrophica bacterium]|nr:hypothetical protein [Candidatus Omnitrophota bacterium]
RRDFNNAVCLMTVIPFLAFVYLLVCEIASFQILAGRIGYIMFIMLFMALMGMHLGRKVIWGIIEKLINLNNQIIRMQEELIEKNRLAAITETVLALGHEINNPLLAIQGNLELLELDYKEGDSLAKRLDTIKTQCLRIGQVTEKLSTLSKPVSIVISGNSRMIDLSKSV